jgi:hypothetical protein
MNAIYFILTGTAGTSFLSSMSVFDPVELAWRDVSNKTSGVSPSPRSDFGFALAGNKLYVHGGYNPSGDPCGHPCLISFCKILSRDSYFLSFLLLFFSARYNALTLS